MGTTVWDRRAKLERVKDGDTIVAILDQGFGDTKQIDVRLLGVWAPESNQPGGRETTQFVQDWFAQLPATTWPFILTTVPMKTVDRELKTFDRYVAIVGSADHSRNLNAEIIAYVQDQGFGGGIGYPST